MNKKNTKILVYHYFANLGKKKKKKEKKEEEKYTPTNVLVFF